MLLIKTGENNELKYINFFILSGAVFKLKLSIFFDCKKQKVKLLKNMIRQKLFTEEFLNQNILMIK